MSKFFNYDDALKASVEYFNGDELAARAFLDKYALRDDKLNLLEETPKDMHHRIAKEFAAAEAKKYTGTAITPLTEEDIFGYLDHFKKIIPQGSPMYGIGNKFQYISLSNCFVVESPADSYGGICKVDEELVQISKRRGGVGVDVSNFRPAGALTHNAARTSTGIIPLQERYSNSIREVGQNGRRGAEMQTISIHHPESVKLLADGVEPQPITVNKGTPREINTTTEFYDPNNLDFATVKYDVSKVTGANISIRLTDEFLTAVDAGTNFEQRWPVESKKPSISKMVDAGRVWKKIVKSAWQMAEPGLLFWDNIIRESPADCYAKLGFKTISTNPCFPSSELLLTDQGYISFGELFQTGIEPFVICDARVSYHGEGTESPDKWSINEDIGGTVVRKAKAVRMTQSMAKLVKITTALGMDVVCTPDHHIATTDGMVEAQYLTADHRILVSVPDSDREVSQKLPSSDNEKLAFLMGLIAGDGTFDKIRSRVYVDLWGTDAKRMASVVTKFIMELHSSIGDIKNSKNRILSPFWVSEDENRQKIRIGSAWLASVLEDKFEFSYKTKHNVPKFVLKNARSDSALFYLQGLFYADGDCGGNHRSGYSVRLSQSNESMLRQVQLVAHANGLLFGLYHRRDSRTVSMPGGIYQTKDEFQLISVGGSWKKFGKVVGFGGHPNDSKLSSFDKNPRERNEYLTYVTRITDAGEQPVFCLEEPVSKSIIVNGLTTRRCGEIPLSAYDSCRLLVLNLLGFVKNAFTKNAYFDYKEFFETVKIAQRLMDDLIDLEVIEIKEIIAKIKNDPENTDTKDRELKLWENILQACEKGRRTGTGITALGDTLAAIGIPYGSDGGIATTERIYKTLKFGAYASSIEMAKVLGAFPVWDHELEKDNPFLNRFKDESIMLNDFPVISGLDLWNDMKKYGRRNIALLTTAPTGTVSIESQTTSGIEPLFMISYKRRKKGNPGDVNFRSDFKDQSGDHWQEFAVFHSRVWNWAAVNGFAEELQKAVDENNDALIASITAHSPWFGSCASEIEWTQRVKLQAAAQRHVDHSISSTLNLPKDVTVEQVDEIYRTAWKYGCKGITIYRDGCRTGVLITNEKPTVKIQKTHAVKRPSTLDCDVFHIKAKGETYFVLVGLIDKGEPYEVFAGKNGMIGKKIKTGVLTKKTRGKYDAVFDDESTLSDVTQYLSDEEEAVTRMVSTSLRHGADVKFIVHQLQKTKGNLFGFARAMSRALSTYVVEKAEQITGETCPDCGNKLIRSEGCTKCANCSFSKCG